MAEKNELNVMGQIKWMLSEETVKKKFSEVLGQKAPQFMASITNVVQGSEQLKQCDAKSILGVLSLDLTKVLTVQFNGENREFEAYLESVSPEAFAAAA